MHWEFSIGDFFSTSLVSSRYISRPFIKKAVIARRLRKDLLQMPTFNRVERYADLRADKELFIRFRNFLDAELSTEILKFLGCVDNFKVQYDNSKKSKRNLRNIHPSALCVGN